MKRNREEDQLQKAVVEWLQVQENLGRLTYFAVPNNPRSARDGARLKQMGLRAGTPDLCILARSRRPLMIELKSPKGRLSIDQKIARDRLDESGCWVAVCRSFDEVKTVVENWYFSGFIVTRAA